MCQLLYTLKKWEHTAVDVPPTKSHVQGWTWSWYQRSLTVGRGLNTLSLTAHSSSVNDGLQRVFWAKGTEYLQYTQSICTEL
jgi:hypothetical protein